MKKFLYAAAAFGLGLVSLAPPAAALTEETEILLELLEAKGVIGKGEAAAFRQAIEERMAAGQATPGRAAASVKQSQPTSGVQDRIDRLEEAVASATGAKNVNISGVIEVEAAAARQKNPAGNSSSTSDISLATAELDVDAAVNDNVDIHVALLYEEGDTDPPNIDEAYVRLHGGDELAAYLQAGRMYVPFGVFSSRFITDPVTLTLGETSDSAILLGYDLAPFSFAVGGFQGAVKKAGKEDKVNVAVAAVSYTLPDGAIPGVAATFTGSWLSNLATSDTLQGMTTTAGQVQEPAAGLGAALHLEVAGRFFLDAEYVGALDDFAATDFTFTDAANRRPRAWNVELATPLTERLEAALRYGGSDEAGTATTAFLPEEEYGLAFGYQLFANTSLTAEYLWQEFTDTSKNRQGGVQLAVEF